MSAGPGALDRVLPSSPAAMQRTVGSGAVERLDQGVDDAPGRAVSTAMPRPAFEDLLAQAGPERPQHARPIAAADAQHDDRDRRGP